MFWRSEAGFKSGNAGTVRAPSRLGQCRNSPGSLQARPLRISLGHFLRRRRRFQALAAPLLFRLIPLPEIREEGLQHSAALLLQHAPGDGGLVVELGHL